MFLQILFFVLSLILTLLFFLYGFNHYYLLSKARRYKTPLLVKPSLDRPSVSIHLPVYNERYVVCRLITACAKMAETYGVDRVNILILDDSDDDTISEVDEIVAEFVKKGIHIEAIRRLSRIGLKAGALQAALERTPEDFIAVFDADFIPPADFLVRTLPYFIQDGRLGIVQSRWGHLNQNFNFLTEAVAIAIDIHFVIEQGGRYFAGLFQNFNGSGGVLRKRAVLEAGGWQADTLAEDLDLSYRMQLLGYHVLYLKDLLSPGEIPPTLPSFKKQQGRWANGTLRTAKKILPLLLPRQEFGLGKRFQAFIHLTGYMLQPLMAFSFVLTCLATFLSLNTFAPLQTISLSIPHEIVGAIEMNAVIRVENLTWFFLGPLIALCTIAPWISSFWTLQEEKLPLFQNLTSLFVLLMLGFGMSVSNSIEAGKALFFHRNWEFTRTPKYADLSSKTGWKAKTYQTALDPVWILEFVFACMGVLAIGFAILHANYAVLLVLVSFTAAYIFTFSLTILQSRSQRAR